MSAHATSALAEAERLMTVCNSCRYCEGLCAVFPAMEMRRVFPDGDLDYLANLCHACGACYVDCQFSPPHEFDVNVPRNLAAVRAESYRRYAWPRALAPLFDRNGLAIALILAASVAVFIAGFAAWHDPAVLFGVHAGPGAFYRLMPHGAMVTIFGAAFLYAVLALTLSLAAFWQATGAAAPPVSRGQLWRAIKDAASLRYLDGGGVGCYREDERPSDGRRAYHHFTFLGFLACFASTVAATLYHYAFGLVAPYAWHELPVVLGTVGGLGLIVGPAGLLADKWLRDPMLRDEPRFGMDVAFLATLFLSGASGLALLLFRATPAMGLLLAAHLGIVFALFVTMPYGKFVHGLYRFLALVRYAHERETQEAAAS